MSIVVNWGDGTTAETFVGADLAFVSHVYADNGNYQILIDVVDEDGTFPLDAIDVTIANVLPVLPFSGASEVDEGSEYMLHLGEILDPGDDTVSQVLVDWGDGSAQSDATGLNSITHVYFDSDHEITVTVIDEDGPHLQSDSIIVQVNDLPPQILLTTSADSINEGLQLTLTLGAITDPGNDSVTLVTGYRVNWGDGITEEFTTAGDKTHTYADGDFNHTIVVDLLATDGDINGAGTVEVSVVNVGPTFKAGADESLAVDESTQVSFDYQIEDAFGETATATVTISITGENDAPTISATNDTVTVNEGNTATNNGSFADFDLTDNVTISAVSIGTITQDTGNSGNWSWSFNTNDGPDESQTVMITANDSHGGVVTTSFDLTVANVAPSVSVSPATQTFSTAIRSRR